MAKIIDFYNNKAMDKRRQEYEDYYGAVYELMLERLDENLPLFIELGMKEITVYEDRTLSYKYKDEDSDDE